MIEGQFSHLRYSQKWLRHEGSMKIKAKHVISKVIISPSLKLAPLHNCQTNTPPPTIIKEGQPLHQLGQPPPSHCHNIGHLNKCYWAKHPLMHWRHKVPPPSIASWLKQPQPLRKMPTPKERTSLLSYHACPIIGRPSPPKRRALKETRHSATLLHLYIIKLRETINLNASTATNLATDSHFARQGSYLRITTLSLKPKHIKHNTLLLRWTWIFMTSALL